MHYFLLENMEIGVHRCIQTFARAHDGASVTSVQFSKNDNYLLTSGRDSVARLWDLRTHKVLVTYVGASTMVCNVPNSNVITNIHNMNLNPLGFAQTYILNELASVFCMFRICRKNNNILNVQLVFNNRQAVVPNAVSATMNVECFPVIVC